MHWILNKFAMIIKNTDELASHGFKEGRKAALEICEYAIRSVNAIDLTKKLLNLKGHILEINGLQLDLAKRNNVYVIGGGKATYSIGKAVEEILGENLTGGIITVKKGEKRRLRKIKVVEAGHPVPDENGYKATREIVDIAQKAGQDDLIICAITGGASALMPQPEDGISMIRSEKHHPAFVRLWSADRRHQYGEKPCLQNKRRKIGEDGPTSNSCRSHPHR